MGIGAYVNRLLGVANLKLSRVAREDFSKVGNRYDLGPETLDGMDREARRILNLLSYTKSSGSSYDAEEYESAYHSITIANQRFAGQRNPGERLDGVSFDFSGATVLDIGCNQGGMLLEVADRIKYGVGVDFDHRMVNAANRICWNKQVDNLKFYIFDVQRENLEMLPNLIPDSKVDIVFLLAVCMWITKWKELITLCATLSDRMLFESNGSDEQQREQEEFLEATYGRMDIVRLSSPDDPKQKKRKLYLCSVRSDADA